MIGSRPIATREPETASSPRAGTALAAVVVAGAVARILSLLSPGHGGDMFAFMTWAEDAAKSGLGSYYANGGASNYPPMLYLLWPLGLTLDDGELAFAIRLLSIPFDLALGALLFDVARDSTGRDRDGLWAAGFYLLNPAVLLCGPLWGQVDAMGALPMVASIVAVVRRRVFLAGLLAVLAGLVKPQFGIAAFTLAGLALFWLRAPGGWRRIVALAGGAVAGFVGVLLPLGLLPFGYAGLMGDTFGQYPFIAEFAFNPWAAVFGFGDPDDDWFRLGTVLAIAGIGASLWLLRRRRDLVGLLGVSVLIGLAIYFLPTRVHERYLFGAVAFLALLAALEPRLRWPFVVLSLAFSLTLAYVVATSPYRILPGPQLPDLLPWAISAASLVMTAIGAWTAWRVVGLYRR